MAKCVLLLMAADQEAKAVIYGQPSHLDYTEFYRLPWHAETQDTSR